MLVVIVLAVVALFARRREAADDPVSVPVRAAGFTADPTLLTWAAIPLAIHAAVDIPLYYAFACRLG